MNSCTSTSFITAFANVIAKQVPPEQLIILSILLTQLADTLAAIDVINSKVNN